MEFEDKNREGLSPKKKINMHYFITTIFNPNLNEFMIGVSDSVLGPSISEGRIIYGKNKLNLSSDGCARAPFEKINISATIKNTGTNQDTRNVQLYVNNSLTQEIQVNLTPQQIKELTFSIPNKNEGKYNITLNWVPKPERVNHVHQILVKIISVEERINPITGDYKTYSIGLVKGPDGVQANSYDDFIVLVNNDNAKNPTYSQLINFLKADRTDQYPYQTVFLLPSFYSGTAESHVNLISIEGIIDGTKQPNTPRICCDFAETLHNNAEKAGIRCAYVSIDFAVGPGHALNAFDTTDRGLVYIDDTGVTGRGPSSCDKIVTVKIGNSYIPTSLFPESGWSSTWGNVGTVTSMYITWDGSWN
jgi:hypothetical protein